jgi:hypothetical protein
MRPCPEETVLWQLLAEKLSDPERSAVEGHLENCGACRERLSRLSEGPLEGHWKVVLGREAPAPPHAPPPQFVQYLAENNPLQEAGRAPAQAGAEPDTTPYSSAGELTSSPGDRGATGTGKAGDDQGAAILPRQLGRYGLLRRLGRGGMGKVYLAEDPRLGRQVAVKVPDLAGPRNAVARERFLREARAAAAVHHPHVCPIYDVGEQDGTPFVVMEYVEGESLAERLRRAGRFADVRAAVALAVQMADGLAAVHAGGTIRRDLKPGNVLLHRDGRAVLTDFGLALRPDDEPLTGLGQVVGTAPYLSPEAVDGQRLDRPSDVFSLGCVLYEMLTGKRPFQGTARDDPPAPRSLRPDLDPALESLVLRAMARRPEERFTAAEMAAALRSWLAPPGRSWNQRRLVLAGVAAALLAGVAWLVLARVPGPRDAGDTSTNAAAASAPFTGYVDVLVWTTARAAPRRMRLTDDGALPLHPGDEFRIEVKATPRAYVYLFWIDTEGVALPVYPWKPGQWGKRPADEMPRDELSLPPTEANGYGISGDKEGMETLLLLARPSRLDAEDEEVRGWFTDVKPQRPVQDPRSAVWFENGRVVQNDARRTRSHFEERQINDPVLRTQELLRERLQPHAAFTAAVSFARLAK